MRTPLIALSALGAAAARAHEVAGSPHHSHLGVDEIFGLIAVAFVIGAWLWRRDPR